MEARAIFGEDVVDALDAECSAFGGALDSLSEAEFARKTNCTPWSVKELVAHVVGSTCFRVANLRPAPGSAPMLEAADYYRRDERSEDGYRQENVDRWQAFAARFDSGRAVSELFAREWRRTVAELRAADLARPVGMHWGDAAMPLGDYVATRLIGVAAHGVDLAISLELDRWTTPSALGVTTPVLRSLLGGDPPAGLNWSDQELLEVGTGRRPLTAAEVDALGDLAPRFPLLS